MVSEGSRVVRSVDEWKPNHSDCLVGTKSTQALIRNSDRVSALFVNDDSEAIYISFGVAARLNKGIRLSPNGGSYQMTVTEKTLTRQDVYAVCSSGNKRLLVTEWT